MPKGGTITWKISLPCSRAEAEIITDENVFIASTDSVPTIVTREDDPRTPNDWVIDVYCDAEPDARMLRNIAKLVPSTTAKPTIEKLGDEDWVTMSQQGLEPLRAGRFYVHTSNSPPLDALNIHNICVDAGQAFGTGHHETTMGCLETLDQLQRQGRHFRNIADIGIGVLSFAFGLQYLWPHAKIIAGDIDIVAVEVSKTNAVANNIKSGHGRGAVRLLQSNGSDNPAFKRRAPFDLIIANILAGPLVSLAPQISAAAKPGTILILAGLLVNQKPAVVSAYTRAGFRLRGTRLESEWPCLTLVKARKYCRIRPIRQPKSPLAADYFGEC